jgi:hypothetical protein
MGGHEEVLQTDENSGLTTPGMVGAVIWNETIAVYDLRIRGCSA